MTCDCGTIQFRTFNKETSWQGQITGTSAAGTSGCTVCPSSTPYTAAGNGQTCTALNCNSVDSDGYVLVPAPVSVIGSNAFKDCNKLSGG